MSWRRRVHCDPHSTKGPKFQPCPSCGKRCNRLYKSAEISQFKCNNCNYLFQFKNVKVSFIKRSLKYRGPARKDKRAMLKPELFKRSQVIAGTKGAK